jgi:hypothetical protein
MFQIKVAEKIKTHILHSVTFFRKSCLLLANVENTVERDRPWCMCIACWVPKATNTLSGSVILIAFPLQQWFMNAAQCYFIRK